MWILLILILHLDSFFTRVTEQLRERLQWFNNTIEVCLFCRLLCILYSLFLTSSSSCFVYMLHPDPDLMSHISLTSC